MEVVKYRNSEGKYSIDLYEDNCTEWLCSFWFCRVDNNVVFISKHCKSGGYDLGYAETVEDAIKLIQEDEPEMTRGNIRIAFNLCGPVDPLEERRYVINGAKFLRCMRPLQIRENDIRQSLTIKLAEAYLRRKKVKFNWNCW